VDLRARLRARGAAPLARQRDSLIGLFLRP
jgi:hypothetical protein